MAAKNRVNENLRQSPLGRLTLVSWPERSENWLELGETCPQQGVCTHHPSAHLPSSRSCPRHVLQTSAPETPSAFLHFGGPGCRRMIVQSFVSQSGGSPVETSYRSPPPARPGAGTCWREI